ncbi:hypothetical protein [Helicobacter pylori]|uniref:hypothetical protein n=1 Tax=Helicobacter pylori TaxID=210 RepID=UPI001E569695|nr:hypothetical protein [Helicobacter pylori]
MPVGKVWFSLCVPIVGILQSLSSNAFPTGLTHHISKGVTLHTSCARYEWGYYYELSGIHSKR